MGRLLAVASSPISDSSPRNGPIFSGAESLRALLAESNGFYAFEGALHVFPSGEGVLPGRSLEEWNSKSLWRESFGHLMKEAVFFAEDVFGGQFAVLPDGAVHLFNPETAVFSRFADDIRGWQDGVIADWNYVTGYSVGREWQERYGALPVGHRLIPRIPFVAGGDFDARNMIPVESVAALNYLGRFAVMLSRVQDGAQIEFSPKLIENLMCGIWSTDESVCRCLTRV